MKRLIALGLLLALAAPGVAQAPLVTPDRRIVAVDWHPGSEVVLRTAPGAPLAVIFEPDEQIQSVVVGDPLAVSVTVAPERDSLVVIAARLPADPVLLVHAGTRDYRFRVVFGPRDDVVYTLRLRTRAALASLPEAPPALSTARYSYRLKGDAALRPLRVSDDGERTMLEWAPDQPLPAIFAINQLGDEETLDSYMRGGVTIIDRVYPKLVFRIGKHRAEATRQEPAKGKAR